MSSAIIRRPDVRSATETLQQLADREGGSLPGGVLAPPAPPVAAVLGQRARFQRCAPGVR